MAEQWLGVIETEARRQIARMEESGAIDPDCAFCKKNLYPYERPMDRMVPRHTAKPNCQSGKHPHCTCDTCF